MRRIVAATVAVILVLVLAVALWRVSLSRNPGPSLSQYGRGNSALAVPAWIRDPQAVTPGTAMPDLRVGERDARDISAFLYTRAGD